jgi:hypothetical protein
VCASIGQVFLRQPPSVEFDFVPDERNNYDPSIHHSELLTGEPIGSGTRFRCTSTRGRRSLDMIVEITDDDRPHRLRTTTHLAAMDITSDLRFEPHEESTLLRWVSDLQTHGPLRLLTHRCRGAPRSLRGRHRAVVAGCRSHPDPGGRGRARHRCHRREPLGQPSPARRG